MAGEMIAAAPYPLVALYDARARLVQCYINLGIRAAASMPFRLECLRPNVTAIVATGRGAVWMHISCPGRIRTRRGGL